MGTTATVSAIFLAGHFSTTSVLTLTNFVVRSRVASYLHAPQDGVLQCYIRTVDAPEYNGYIPLFPRTYQVIMGALCCLARCYVGTPTALYIGSIRTDQRGPALSRTFS